MSGLRQRVEAIADSGPHVIEQEDIFFPCPKTEGRLKFRRLSKDHGELIYYRRLDATGPCESRYIRSTSADPDSLVDALSQALGVRGVVRKHRTLFMVGQTRVHLDDVQGLGTFLELEVVLEPAQSVLEGTAVARQIMARLAVEEGDLVKEAYIDLIDL
jgi:adenylate cyclase